MVCPAYHAYHGFLFPKPGAGGSMGQVVPPAQNYGADLSATDFFQLLQGSWNKNFPTCRGWKPKEWYSVGIRNAWFSCIFSCSIFCLKVGFWNAKFVPPSCSSAFQGDPTATRHKPRQHLAGSMGNNTCSHARFGGCWPPSWGPCKGSLPQAGTVKWTNSALPTVKSLEKEGRLLGSLAMKKLSRCRVYCAIFIHFHHGLT